MRYNTGNPVGTDGSSSPFDLHDNSGNIDVWANDRSRLTWPDRLGVDRKTFFGMEQQVTDFLINMSYESVYLVYGAGVVVERQTQLVQRDGELYRVMNAADIPLTLTGTWATDAPKLQAVGDAALRQALASQIGAGMIGFDPDHAYLNGTVGYALLASLPAFVSARAYGAKGDGVTDDTVSIQAARDSGFPILFGPGTYILTLSQSINLEGGPSVCAIKGKCVFRGAGMGRTVFKIRDGESTDASPKNFNMIAINTLVDGLLLEDITFDLNGQNNKISPNRASGVYNYFNCAALMVSGSVSTVGEDARLVNSKILRCEVINSPGVTCIALGQSNTNSSGGGLGSTLGNNVEISGCRFYNNGLDANDHSSVYMWCNGVWVHHCTFDNPTMSSGVQGPLAAAELHGSANRFTDNTVNNYLWGVYVAGNYTTVSRGQYVLNNEFFVAQKAVILFNETATEPGMAEVKIVGNNVWLTHDHPHADGKAKSCFDLAPSQGEVDGLLVTGNTLFTTDPYGAVALRVGVLASTKIMRNVLLSNNLIKGFGTPIQFGVSGGGIIDDLKISGNLLSDIKQNATTGTNTLGIYGVGSNGTVDISYNKSVGLTFSDPFYGVYLDTGVMSNLNMQGNAFDSGTANPIIDMVNVVGRRSGEQTLVFNALPAQSTWKIGDRIFNGDPAELGTTPNKYVILGWVRVTNGASNTATDWLQLRSLTGN